MSQLHQLGSTQQALLRHLLRHPAGVDVESLCTFLRVSHNAVRQHLTALSARKWVERAESISTGGRPQARFRLTTAAHDLFPRNYALIAGALLEAVTARIGREEAQDVLTQLGRSLGESEPTLARDSDQEVAEALAERLSRAGYEAIATTRGGPAQVEAFNCVSTRWPGSTATSVASTSRSWKPRREGVSSTPNALSGADMSAGFS